MPVVTKKAGYTDSYENGLYTLELWALAPDLAKEVAEAYRKGLAQPGMRKSLIVVNKECNMLGKDFQKMWKEASEIPSDFVVASAVVVPSPVIKFLLEQLTTTGKTEVKFFLKRDEAEVWITSK